MSEARTLLRALVEDSQAGGYCNVCDGWGYNHTEDCSVAAARAYLAAAPAGIEAHRSAEELGHIADSALFHVTICTRCGLMLAYLVRDQVECAAYAAAESAGEGE